jgi:hypothetical protein
MPSKLMRPKQFTPQKIEKRLVIVAFRVACGERIDYWYRALRALSITERKFYATRHTFISAAPSAGVKIKWRAEYCGTSVAMIEKHYGKDIGGDDDEQFSRLLARKLRDLFE